jgi:hypothetical protein
MLGHFGCPCGNRISVEDVVLHQNGSAAAVEIWPYSVRCGGCGDHMNLRYDEDELHGELSSVPGRDHMGSAAERGSDPARREGAPGLGGGPLPDHGVHRPAEDRGGESGHAEAGDGGPSGDLPPAASHLAIGSPYVLKQGDHQECIGELRHVDVTDFGFVYATLDVHTPGGLVEGVRLNADFLEPFELDA